MKGERTRWSYAVCDISVLLANLAWLRRILIICVTERSNLFLCYVIHFRGRLQSPFFTENKYSYFKLHNVSHYLYFISRLRSLWNSANKICTAYFILQPRGHMLSSYEDDLIMAHFSLPSPPHRIQHLCRLFITAWFSSVFPTHFLEMRLYHIIYAQVMFFMSTKLLRKSHKTQNNIFSLRE